MERDRSRDRAHEPTVLEMSIGRLCVTGCLGFGLNALVTHLAMRVRSLAEPREQMDHEALASRRLHLDRILDNSRLGNGRGFACRLSKHLCQLLDGSESLKGDWRFDGYLSGLERPVGEGRFSRHDGSDEL